MKEMNERHERERKTIEHESKPCPSQGGIIFVLDPFFGPVPVVLR